MGMRNWEQENIIKKHLLGCYVDPDTKQRIKALARARRVTISQLTREMVELALPQLEANLARDGQVNELSHEPETGKLVPALVELAPMTTAASINRNIGGVLRWLATQHESNSNDTTCWAAHCLRSAGVPLEHAQALLVPLATSLGLPAHEAEYTIASAYSQHDHSTSS